MPIRNRPRRRRRQKFPLRGLLYLVLAVLVAALLPVVVSALAGGTQTKSAAPTPSAQRPSHSPSSSPSLSPAPSVEESLQRLADSPAIQVYDHQSDTVRSMGLELYTLLATGAEMPASYELEALKAQAVAARTLAVNKQQRGGCGVGGEGKSADVCTRYDSCQAYRSLDSYKEGWGDAYATNMAKLVQAVNETQGQILTYDGEAIITFFHSTSGGTTETVQNVFSQTLPYYQTVSSPGEEWAPRYTGEVRLSRAEFARTVNAAYGEASLSAAGLEGQVEILGHTDSGRVDDIRLGGVTLRATKLRALLGLNSTNFTVAYEGEDIVFSTKGYGHGIGMSQTGADAMAMRGSGYQEILAHYYVGTELQELR